MWKYPAVCVYDVLSVSLMSVEVFTTESQSCIFDSISRESLERSFEMIARFNAFVLKGTQKGLITDHFKLHTYTVWTRLYVKSTAFGDKCSLFWCLESVSVSLCDLLACWLGRMFVECLHLSVDVCGLMGNGWLLEDGCWQSVIKHLDAVNFALL